MNKPVNNEVSSELVNLLVQISEGKTTKGLRKEANRLIAQVSPNDIASAESEMLKNGFTAKRVQQLSAAFVLMGVLESSKSNLQHRLPDGHLLRKIMAEHEMFRCFLADLEEVTNRISEMDDLSDASCEFMRLSHIIEHLNAMEEHHDRENDILIPYLKKMGWEHLCRSVESDHLYLTVAVNDLVKLITGFRRIRFSVFKSRLSSLVRYICPAMKEHLFHEDHVLFPLAVEIITDDKVWLHLKKVCDEIDYCGIHL